MYFWFAIIVLGTTLPHSKVRRAVRSFYVINQILNERDLILCINYLKTGGDHLNQKYYVNGHGVDL